MDEVLEVLKEQMINMAKPVDRNKSKVAIMDGDFEKTPHVPRLMKKVQAGGGPSSTRPKLVKKDEVLNMINEDKSKLDSLNVVKLNRDKKNKEEKFFAKTEVEEKEEHDKRMNMDRKDKEEKLNRDKKAQEEKDKKAKDK